MGVKGLWRLLRPAARPVRLEALAGARLAVDASIWLHQFAKAMRGADGRALPGAHVLGFFRRICKLLFYGIRPVFVFDGGVPVLKRRAIDARRRRKTQAERNYTRAAERLLQAQLKLAAVQSVRSAGDDTVAAGAATQRSSDAVSKLPADIVYADNTGNVAPADLEGTAHSAQAAQRKRKRDDYDLPDVAMFALDDLDPRLASRRDLLGFIASQVAAVQDPQGGDIGTRGVTSPTSPNSPVAPASIAATTSVKSAGDNYAISSGNTGAEILVGGRKLDLDSTYFQSLPPEVQYEIIVDLKNKSREPTYNHAIYEVSDPLEFSKRQIFGVVKRNDLTQRAMTFMKTGAGSSASNGDADAEAKDPDAAVHNAPRRRIAGAKSREFVLVRNDEQNVGFRFRVANDEDNDDVDNNRAKDASKVKAENDIRSFLLPHSRTRFAGVGIGVGESTDITEEGRLQASAAVEVKAEDEYDDDPLKVFADDEEDEDFVEVSLPPSSSPFHSRPAAGRTKQPQGPAASPSAGRSIREISSNAESDVGSDLGSLLKGDMSTTHSSDADVNQAIALAVRESLMESFGDEALPSNRNVYKKSTPVIDLTGVTDDDEETDDDLQRAIALSLETAVTGTGIGGNTGATGSSSSRDLLDADAEDEDLRRAIALSLQASSDEQRFDATKTSQQAQKELSTTSVIDVEQYLTPNERRGYAKGKNKPLHNRGGISAFYTQSYENEEAAKESESSESETVQTLSASLGKLRRRLAVAAPEEFRSQFSMDLLDAITAWSVRELRSELLSTARTLEKEDRGGDRESGRAPTVRVVALRFWKRALEAVISEHEEWATRDHQDISNVPVRRNPGMAHSTMPAEEPKTNAVGGGLFDSDDEDECIVVHNRSEQTATTPLPLPVSTSASAEDLELLPRRMSIMSPDGIDRTLLADDDIVVVRRNGHADVPSLEDADDEEPVITIIPNKPSLEFKRDSSILSVVSGRSAEIVSSLRHKSFTPPPGEAEMPALEEKNVDAVPLHDMSSQKRSVLDDEVDNFEIVGTAEVGPVADTTITPASQELTSDKPEDAVSLSRMSQISLGDQQQGQREAQAALNSDTDEASLDDINDESELIDNEDEQEENIDVPTDLQEEFDGYQQFVAQVSKRGLQDVEKDIEGEIASLRTMAKKGQRDASTIDAQMTDDVKMLLRLFGLPYVVAPMEAESQCAFLLERGLVDGIVTDDSDVFLFGGTRVYKNMFNQSKTVECYLISDLARELKIDRPTLIRLAYLLGSDYTEGIQGVGIVSAMEIIREWCIRQQDGEGGRDRNSDGSEAEIGNPAEEDGDKDEVEDDVNVDDIDETKWGPVDDPGQGVVALQGLRKFSKWCDAVRHGQLTGAALRRRKNQRRRKFRKLAARVAIPKSFPDPTVARAYMRPEVNESDAQFEWHIPDMDAIRRFMDDRLGWSRDKVNEVLVPVLRAMQERESAALAAASDPSMRQRTLDEFLGAPTSAKDNIGRVVTSARLKSAVKAIASAKSGNGSAGRRVIKRGAVGRGRGRGKR